MAIAQIPLAPEEGVVVLRNGYTLRGRITPLGDYYLVTFGEGGDAKLSADQVEMCCRDLEEAYRRKRDDLAKRDVPARLELAEWCLRHGLAARAADQLLAAWSLDPKQPRLASLERRLQLDCRGTPAGDSTTASTRPIVPDDQLERAMRELPEGAVERFTLAVQPLLVNRCGTNACHGAGAKSNFRLMSPVRGRTMNRRLTQRNLYAALALVDQQSPEQSQLLTVLSQQHAGGDAPLFGQHDRGHYELLADWVRQVSQPKNSSQPARMAKPDGLLLQTLDRRLSREGTRFAPDHWRKQLAPLHGSAARAVESGRETTPSERPASGEPATTDFTPRDPFDPEIYNRRYFADP